MDYEEISALRRQSVAWRLLRADHSPLVLSFLGRVFVNENVRSISASDLAGRLDDELYALNERLGPGVFPKAARAYLEDWANPQAGYLRKYYPEGSDEPNYDATPAVEKALAWIRVLTERSFVGTESRLNTIFELLRQMVFGAEADPEARLEELRRRRREIDEEIARVAAGDFEPLGPTAQRERYQQFAGTARELLADFREVEANFRVLDRRLREKISTWEGSKGALLDDILGNRESIADSDQGKSFQAFYDFLLSSARQEELADLLEQVQALEEITDPDPRMRYVHYDWLDAGERTQATVRQLSEQLRRFLDDQVWAENRRVVEIVRGIEKHALAVRADGAALVITELDGTAPALGLPMERPLYTPRVKKPINSTAIEAGRQGFETDPLFEQFYVDRAELASGVRRALQGRSQIGLAELVRGRPLTQGLAQLVSYLALSDDTFRLVFDESRTDEVSWQDDEGTERRATLPRVTFSRTGEEGR
jgi:flagellar motility protein MotE (MotC chaperone)